MNRLRSIREKKSLTLAQVSARTSIPVRLLTDYEENQLEIPAPHMKALAKALWVKPEELLIPAAAAPPAPPPPPAPVAPSYVPPAAEGAGEAPPVAIAPPMEPPVMASPGAAPPYRPTPAPPGPAPNGGMGGPPRPGYASPPGRRPGAGPPAGDRGPGRPPMGGRPRREPLAMPATEGQVTEIMRLAARLNLSTAQLEEEFGRPLADITRFDAREWIKKLREDAAAKAPPSKIHFGQWPGLKDDLEAVYLNEQKEALAPFRVTLFNGQVFEGALIDFTPYTVTLAETGSGDHIVLRKLAIAYYRRLGDGPGAAPADAASPNGHEVNDPAPFNGPAEPSFGRPDTEPAADPPGGDAA